MGRLVHGSVLTVVGQDSMPISTAIRSLRQNSSSWFRRRATASNVPSSKKALFRLVMVPPKNRVGDAVTRRFVPALAEKFMSMIPRTLNSIQQNGRFWDWRRTTFSTGRDLWKSTVRSYLGACRKSGHRTSSVDVHDTVTLTGVTVAQLQSHLSDFGDQSRPRGAPEARTTSDY
jgi:hypothetical protein